MSVSTYEDLAAHVGHQIVCVRYGEDDGNGVNVAIECETCNTILLDFNRPDQPEVPEGFPEQLEAFVADPESSVRLWPPVPAWATSGRMVRHQDCQRLAGRALTGPVWQEVIYENDRRPGQLERWVLDFQGNWQQVEDQPGKEQLR